MVVKAEGYETGWDQVEIAEGRTAVLDLVLDSAEEP